MMLLKKSNLRKKATLLKFYFLSLISCMPFAFIFPLLSWPSDPALAQSATDFEFVQKYLLEAVSNLSAQDATYARREELAASLNTAQKGNLPTVGLNADAALSKSFQYNDTARLNATDKAVTSYTAGITAKQNLYSGGATGLRIDAAQFRLNSQNLSVAGRTDVVRLALVKDFVTIVGLQHALLLKKTVLEQADALHNIAQRKQKSGVLGVKEAVEASREAMRASNDFRDTQMALSNQVSNFNSKYLLSQNKLQEKDLSSLEKGMMPLFSKGEAWLELATFSKEVASKTAGLKQSLLEEQALDADLSVARTQQYNPSLDLSLGIQGSVNDLSNVPTLVRGQAANRQWQPQARLSFTMSLYNPATAAQSEEVAMRKKSILAERQGTLLGIENKLKSAQLEKAAQQSKLQGLRRVSLMSMDIRQKDGRLFDAGETTIEQVIRDQQELNSENAAIMDLENQLRSLFVDTAHAGTFGYLPDTGAIK